MHPFRGLAELLYDHMASPGRKSPLTKDLEALSFRRKTCVRDYYVRKITDTLLLLAVLTLASLVLVTLSARQDRSLSSGLVMRPTYGEEDREENLALSVKGQDESELTVHISSRKYTAAEVEALLKKAEGQLLDMIQGDNASLDRVQRDLCFPSVLLDGQVKAEYSVTPLQLVDSGSGRIIGTPAPEGTPVAIEATLTLQKTNRVLQLAAVLYPPRLSAKELLQSEVDQALLSADQGDPSSASVRLPDRAGPYPLSWKLPRHSPLPLALAVTLLLPLFLWIERDEHVRQKALARRKRLDLDYSELLFKLTLLLGAGLTIKGAFSRILAQEEDHIRRNRRKGTGSLAVRIRILSFSMKGQFSRRARDRAADGVQNRVQKAPSDYVRAMPPGSVHRSSPTSRSFPSPSRKDADVWTFHPVYGEVRILLREISAGVPQETAYENFGRRCGLPQYIKLGSILAQNLRKGSHGLTDLLEKEAFLSLQQHKTAARKLGDEASMKLLFPMILIFLDVMLILLLPALMGL